MKKEKYSFMSADCVTDISCVDYVPNHGTDVKAVLMVSHGIGQHKEVFEELAEKLTEEGIAVCAMDTIGHGKSVSRRKNPMYFGTKGAWDFVVRDFVSFNQIVADNYPERPIYVMGFSMGSFVARTFLVSDHFEPEYNRVDGIILAGTGALSGAMAKLVIAMTEMEAKKAGGEDRTSARINALAFGNYNRYFRPAKTEVDWLFQNENAAKEYMDDPVSKKYITPGMFRELISAMAYTSKRSTIKESFRKHNVPVLFISGANDPLGGFMKQIFKMNKTFKKAGFKTEVVSYPESRHDLFHDSDKVKVAEDILAWIEKHC